MKSSKPMFLLLPVLISGCVTTNTSLDESKAASVTHIHIAPIESPPLSGLGLSNIKMPGAVLVSGGTMTGSNGIVALGGVMMLISIPDANRRSAVASQNIEALLDKNEVWEPTVEIAMQARHALETADRYTVSTHPTTQPLPGVTRREATLLMENWMAPLRNWYNMDTSPFRYTEQPDSGVMLEIGLSNYELNWGTMLIQVLMKIVEPDSGIVIANARCYSTRTVDNVDQLFEDGAVRYKQMFRSITAPLVTECIEKLGLETI